MPALRTLSFVDLPAITDSILAWISIKAHGILLLALRGTNISRKAVMSVRDRFPNSDMLHNANFYGFWPKHRVEDRMLINKYHHMVDGITRVQARMRKHFAQLRVSGISFERRRLAAFFTLHRIARGFIGRRRAFWRRYLRDKTQDAAVKISTIFHIARAKKRVARREGVSATSDDGAQGGADTALLAGSIET